MLLSVCKRERGSEEAKNANHGIERICGGDAVGSAFGAGLSVCLCACSGDSRRGSWESTTFRTRQMQRRDAVSAPDNQAARRGKRKWRWIDGVGGVAGEKADTL